MLDLANMAALEKLGVNAAKYQSFDYSVTSRITAATAFLEFDAMLVPSARFAGRNLVISMNGPVDWSW